MVELNSRHREGDWRVKVLRQVSGCFLFLKFFRRDFLSISCVGREAGEGGLHTAITSASVDVFVRGVHINFFFSPSRFDTGFPFSPAPDVVEEQHKDPFCRRGRRLRRCGRRPQLYSVEVFAGRKGVTPRSS